MRVLMRMTMSWLEPPLRTWHYPKFLPGYWTPKRQPKDGWSCVPVILIGSTAPAPSLLKNGSTSFSNADLNPVVVWEILALMPRHVSEPALGAFFAWARTRLPLPAAKHLQSLVIERSSLFS